jgi:hypothetical protein
MTETPPDQDEPDHATRYNLRCVLRDLPYAGALPPPPEWSTSADGLFMAMVAEWLTEYSQVVAVARSTHADMARELTELRDQRSAIRSFLGTTEGTT